ncbi:MAG: leucine-rich repeat domain-containing protein [Bacteroides sp.]|nr:leucine-rich repeat domain-containing protein [Prevotella sp.]MCM1408366.1 leucine-rich repeat domain-containing protein [Treponema brennaborense]MCM1470403.1 leucine-rich repeat domain-containing protein [Bacteroides sp.]
MRKNFGGTCRRMADCVGGGIFLTSCSEVEAADKRLTIEDGVLVSCDSDATGHIDIPSRVKTIGYRAFFKRGGITSVTIPDSVTKIDTEAFSRCSGLTSVTIPSGVWYIGTGAFEYCSGLTSVTIPASVTTIEQYAFYECGNLKTVKYLGTKTQWNGIAKESLSFPSCTIYYNAE